MFTWYLFMRRNFTEGLCALKIKSGSDGSAPYLPRKQQWAQDDMGFLNKKRIKKVLVRSGQNLEENLHARMEKSEERYHSDNDLLFSTT